MSYFEFPHTRTYDNDLGWIIRHLIGMSETIENFVNFNTIKYADPIAWDITHQYEGNTVVINPYDGTAYISTRAVPSGVSISNTDYWTPIFNYGESMDTLREQIAAANEEASPTATQAYSENELLWMNGELYSAMYAFPAGTALLPGTNIDKVTVEDVINSLRALIAANTAAINDMTPKAEVAAANEGSSATSTQAYSKGDLLWSNGVLYRVLYDFPTGTALLPGTNIESVTVESLLGDLLTLININAGDIATFKSIIVTPEMYGAAGDGVTDDTQAIIDALASGGLVRMMNSYVITSQIALPDHARIFGSGTIIDRVPAALSTDPLYTQGSFIAHNANDISIEGITIDGEGYRSSYLLKTAIYILTSDNVRIEGITIHDYPGLGGIVARASNHVRVNRCVIKDYTYSGVMFVEGTSYSSVTYCDIVDGHETAHSSRYPIMICGYQEDYTGLTAPQAYMINCAYNLVSDTDAWWEGIDAHGGEFLYVHHNRLVNVAGGISVFTNASRGFTVRYAWIYGNAVYNTVSAITNASTIYGSAFGGNNIYVFENTFANGGRSSPLPTSAGIYLDQGIPIEFRENKVDKSYATGILLAGSYNHAKISENLISGVIADGSLAYGIRFYDSMGSVYRVYIEENTFEGTMTHIKGPRNKSVASQWVELIGNKYLSGVPVFENVAYISPDMATPAQIADTTHGTDGKYCANATHTASGASPVGWVLHNVTQHEGTWEPIYPDGNVWIGPALTVTEALNGVIGYQESLDPVTIPPVPTGWVRIGYICNSGNSRIANPSFVKDGVLAWYNRTTSTDNAIIQIFPVYRRNV